MITTRQFANCKVKQNTVIGTTVDSSLLMRENSIFFHKGEKGIFFQLFTWLKPSCSK